MDLVANIQYDAVECLNQSGDGDLAHSLLRQMQAESEQTVIVDSSCSEQQGFGVIQSHDHDPQLLIKVPFIEPDLPNMDFSDVDKPPLHQFSLSALDAVPDEGITLSINPIKSRQCNNLALFLENSVGNSVAISSLTVFGTIVQGSRGTLKKIKGWQPFTKSTSITAFIRNNTDFKNNKTVMERQRVDMHDLQVAEALAILDYLSRRYREAHLPYLDVITGKGNHSPEGKPNIKPAVEGWLVSNQFQRLSLTVDEFKIQADYKNAFSENPTNSDCKIPATLSSLNLYSLRKRLLATKYGDDNLHVNATRGSAQNKRKVIRICLISTSFLSKISNQREQERKREMAYKQRWLEYFDVLDADKSNFIDAGDIAYYTKIAAKSLNKPEDSPEAKKVGDSVAKQFKAIIHQFDANQDGKVSREEMLDGVEKYFIGKTVETLPDWWRANTDQFFEVVDTNKNGELSLKEYIDFLRNVDKESTDAEVTEAYNWAVKQSASGKFDSPTFAKVIFIWATSPNPTPEASRLLFYLTKVGKEHLK